MPGWAIGGALIPALIITVLFYFDHSVSSQLAQVPLAASFWSALCETKALYQLRLSVNWPRRVPNRRRCDPSLRHARALVPRTWPLSCSQPRTASAHNGPRISSGSSTKPILRKSLSRPAQCTLSCAQTPASSTSRSRRRTTATFASLGIVRSVMKYQPDLALSTHDAGTGVQPQKAAGVQLRLCAAGGHHRRLWAHRPAARQRRAAAGACLHFRHVSTPYVHGTFEDSEISGSECSAGLNLRRTSTMIRSLRPPASKWRAAAQRLGFSRDDHLRIVSRVLLLCAGSDAHAQSGNAEAADRA